MSVGVHAFTSVTSNYIPKARVLAESVKKLDPSVSFHLLLSDELPPGFDLDNEPFDNVIFAESLPVDSFKGWVFSHRLVELCTAVKGLAVETLFENYQADKVFYFDPDIVVFSRLQELIDELDSCNLLLTPHQSDPETSIKAIMDNEMASLRHGVFNLGFVGVANKPEGRKFSRWWRDRLIHFCHDDHSRSLFTDQKWVNLAPCMFEGVRILRSPGFNVATWNITTRKATGSVESGVEINGEPLGFYHFSGFDSGDQEIQLNEYGHHSPVLFELREWYIDQCEHHGQSELGVIPAKYNFFDDGSKIEDRQRLLYREREDLKAAFPDPFVTENLSKPELAGGYKAWFAVQAEHMAEDDIIQVKPNTPIREFLKSSAEYLERSARNSNTLSHLKRLGLRGVIVVLRLAARLASRAAA